MLTLYYRHILLEGVGDPPCNGGKPIFL
jgi:hypothetical protein